MSQKDPSPPQEQLLLDGSDPSGDDSGEKASSLPMVRVLLEEAALELDYLVPDELAHRIKIGSRVHVPLQGRRAAAVIVQFITESPFAGRLKSIADTIGTKPMFTPHVLKMAHWMADYYLSPLGLVLRTMLPEAVRNKPESFLSDSHISLAKTPTEDEMNKLRKAAPIQARIIEILQSLGGEATLSVLRKELPRAATTLHVLAKKGLITRSEVRVERDPFHDEEFTASAPLTLTEEQQVAFNAVSAVLRTDDPVKKPMLLHGVTGSGKTEVYLQAIAQVLEAGKTALVLVPEISLTPQTIERFKSRFSERKQRIAVLHSHLSDGERHDEWFKIHEGRADIVIGARSAIFAPLENVGIIIVDEEHETGYKQDENPRYQARDLAVVRAKLEGCLCLLGSATPSLESFENARSEKYTLLELTRRTDGKSMPFIRIVDLRLEKRKTKEGFSILSEKLRMAMQQRLDRGEQIILLLNRRGFNTALSCMQCGAVCQCTECAVPFTYHKKDDRLICHVCGMRRVPPRKCDACGESSLVYGGFGTERAEESIRTVFPTARITRMDTDTMQRKNQLRDTLKAFRSQKLDIIIGTQMIAKGLDFPNVTLVGVLNADLALNLPDFRAAERTFQLLTQVAGRAGRGEVKGEVYIQTHAPHSPAVQFARQGDFAGFAEQELEHRRQGNYPPCSHIVLIGCRGKQASHAEFALQTLAGRLRKGLTEEMQMGEPNPSPLEKAHGQYRFQLLLRSNRIRPLVAHLRRVLAGMTFPEDVIITWDVDAVSML